MTSYERIKRMFEHQEADRIPIIDHPWESTIERWHKEGMPENISYVDYFDMDHIATITVDNSPRFKTKVLEDTEEYKVSTSSWGATLKNWKHAASTPQFLDFTITDPEKWKEAKKRITPDKDRINWKYLKNNYRRWRENGYWIEAGLWFGFDVTHSWIVGTERLLYALVEKPEWCMDMFSHLLEVNLNE